MKGHNLKLAISAEGCIALPGQRRPIGGRDRTGPGFRRARAAGSRVKIDTQMVNGDTLVRWGVPSFYIYAYLFPIYYNQRG